MYYSGIVPCDVANGEGVRVSLFVAGCNFHCKGCFNTDAQKFQYGKEYTDETREEIFSLLNDEKIDGLSILGGDPLCQSVDGMDELLKLCTYAKKLGKNVWIWSGFTWESIFDEEKKLSFEDIYRMVLIQNCDVFIDGQFMQDKKDLSLAWRGSKNQRIIDVKKTLSKGRVTQYVLEQEIKG